MVLSQIFHRVLTYSLVAKSRLIGSFLKIYLLALGCRVGSGLKCAGWPVFRAIPKGNVVLGNRVALGKGVVLEFPPGGRLELGNDVMIGDYSLLSSAGEIKFADWSGIGERCSIRGTMHGLAAGTQPRWQPSETLSISLGYGTVVGAGTVVLGGVHLPEGVVVGANAVLTPKCTFAANSIYGGIPAKLLRTRS